MDKLTDWISSMSLFCTYIGYDTLLIIIRELNGHDQYRHAWL